MPKTCLKDHLAPHAKTVVRKSRPAEHLGFVAYAGAEVLHLGQAVVYAVATWLFITGLMVLFSIDIAELFGKEL